MAFSSTDLSNVESAIVALATGARIVQVSIAGKQIMYQQVDLDKLQALLATIKANLGTTEARVYAKNGGRSS